MSRTKPEAVRRLRCAIYTRKSSEEGLDMEFNSLDAQREACEAYIASQRAEGWVALRDRYDDGGFSGGTLDRPALQQLIADIEAGLIDVVVVYKIDRLSRALMDFSKLVEIFDRHGVTFVSVTQSFNTTTSMGRLTLNILLSFAQGSRHPAGEPAQACSPHPRRDARTAEAAAVRAGRRRLLADAYPQGRPALPLLRQPDGAEARRGGLSGRPSPRRRDRGGRHRSGARRIPPAGDRGGDMEGRARPRRRHHRGRRPRGASAA